MEVLKINKTKHKMYKQTEKGETKRRPPIRLKLEKKKKRKTPILSVLIYPTQNFMSPENLMVRPYVDITLENFPYFYELFAM